MSPMSRSEGSGSDGRAALLLLLLPSVGEPMLPTLLAPLLPSSSGASPLRTLGLRSGKSSGTTWNGLT
jgi:hypothetical protein